MRGKYSSKDGGWREEEILGAFSAWRQERSVYSSRSWLVAVANPVANPVANHKRASSSVSSRSLIEGSVTYSLTSVPVSHPTSPSHTRTELTLTPSSTSSPVDSDPRLKLSLALTSPYRSTVLAFQSLARPYFAGVDAVVDYAGPTLSKAYVAVAGAVNPKYLVLPMIPVLVLGAVLTPPLAGLAVIGLPLFLPLLVISALLSLLLLTTLTTLYLSTSHGRTSLTAFLTPHLTTALKHRPVQSLLYTALPTPTPVAIVKPLLPVTPGARLTLCLLIDFLGSSSYLIPGAGEAFDLFWAPAQTVMLQGMYGGSQPNLKVRCGEY